MACYEWHPAAEKGSARRPAGEGTLDERAAIVLGQGIEHEGRAEAVLERAVAVANRTGPWRSWNFLTLQIQIAAEQFASSTTAEVPPVVRQDERTSDWTAIKQRICHKIPEVAFLNWLEATRQVERCGAELVVAVPDDQRQSTY